MKKSEKAKNKQINKNSNAGNDFLRGSLILICITIDPSNKKASPNAEGIKNSGNHMATIRPNAKATFRNPITYKLQSGIPYT